MRNGPAKLDDFQRPERPRSQWPPAALEALALCPLDPCPLSACPLPLCLLPLCPLPCYGSFCMFTPNPSVRYENQRRPHVMAQPCQAPRNGESPGLMFDWYARPAGSPQQKPAGPVTQSTVPRPPQKDEPRGATRRNPQPRSAQQPAKPPLATLGEPQQHVSQVPM